MTNSAPKAALIIIGNEILSGRTEDKNIHHIAKELGNIGIRFLETRIIPDIGQTIIQTVNDLRGNYDYVFTTGGIGPTHDDITSQAIAKAFGVKLVHNEEAFNRLNEYYKGDLNEGRIKMSQMPQGAKLIDNPISIAPGFIIENVYVMAGIPNVMHAMLDGIKGNLKGGAVILSKEIKVLTSESKIATPLRKLQDKHPDVEIGSYPFIKDAKLGISLVLRSTDQKKLDAVYKELSVIVKDYEKL